MRCEMMEAPSSYGFTASALYDTIHGRVRSPMQQNMNRHPNCQLDPVDDHCDDLLPLEIDDDPLIEPDTQSCDPHCPSSSDHDMHSQHIESNTLTCDSLDRPSETEDRQQTILSCGVFSLYIPPHSPTEDFEPDTLPCDFLGSSPSDPAPNADDEPRTLPHAASPSNHESQDDSEPDTLPYDPHAVLSSDNKRQDDSEPDTPPYDPHDILPSDNERQDDSEPDTLPYDACAAPSTHHQYQDDSEPDTLPYDSHAILPSDNDRGDDSEPDTLPYDPHAVLSLDNERQDDSEPDTLPYNAFDAPVSGPAGDSDTLPYNRYASSGCDDNNSQDSETDTLPYEKEEEDQQDAAASTNQVPDTPRMPTSVPMDVVCGDASIMARVNEIRKRQANRESIRPCAVPEEDPLGGDNLGLSLDLDEFYGDIISFPEKSKESSDNDASTEHCDEPVDDEVHDFTASLSIGQCQPPSPASASEISKEAHSFSSSETRPNFHAPSTDAAAVRTHTRTSTGPRKRTLTHAKRITDHCEIGCFDPLDDHIAEFSDDEEAVIMPVVSDVEAFTPTSSDAESHPAIPDSHEQVSDHGADAVSYHDQSHRSCQVASDMCLDTAEPPKENHAFAETRDKAMRYDPADVMSEVDSNDSQSACDMEPYVLADQSYDGSFDIDTYQVFSPELSTDLSAHYVETSDQSDYEIHDLLGIHDSLSSSDDDDRDEDMLASNTVMRGRSMSLQEAMEKSEIDSSQRKLKRQRTLLDMSFISSSGSSSLSLSQRSGASQQSILSSLSQPRSMTPEITTMKGFDRIVKPNAPRSMSSSSQTEGKEWMPHRSDVSKDDTEKVDSDSQKTQDSSISTSVGSRSRRSSSSISFEALIPAGPRRPTIGLSKKRSCPRLFKGSTSTHGDSAAASIPVSKPIGITKAVARKRSYGMRAKHL
ncbi:uncharacterized protein BYT42DRAFT_55512 [Radiomyces spectabilis]|uniref:uncharacterized protein n=1 Tax=Radiomyces spectabilis TaxID=64574 RepID=UPI00221F7682|nr:uncharacterized protein BYT42DRAFT_55512 [Radiomyces spectabilis]KAI8373012.1 hypothetical protein BYT42DRAFT_55512 [Radiomyces spectabilis]